MLIGLSNNSSGTANLATTSYLYNSQGLNEALNFLTSTGTALATENFSYDGDLRPAGGTATWQSGSGNTVGSTIFSQGIGYDAAGNVISQTITQAAVPGQTGSGGSETQNFCYDEQNRLIWSSNHSTTKPTGSITCGSVAWQSTWEATIPTTSPIRTWDSSGKAHSTAPAPTSISIATPPPALTSTS